jgi:hypothetical protein
MVIIKQEHNEETKRERGEDPLYVKIPKVYQPTPRLRRTECFCYRNHTDACCPKSTGEMSKSYPEKRHYLATGQLRPTDHLIENLTT